MKKIILISLFLLGAAFYKADAQVHVDINIGNQPVWGPPGYDYVDNYYLPDLGIYYNVPRREFIYFDFDRWVFAAELPGRFGRYDLYNCYKVVINDREPWLRHSYYSNYYDNYRGRYQPVLRDARIYNNQGPYVYNNRVERDYRYEPREGRYESNRGYGRSYEVRRDNDRGRGRGGYGRDRR